ncbi:glycosyl hydrolase family 18 protein [Paenibacillus aceris]|uniref:Spore germination protein YaaH n=1 Tax=Paenibacillus aceris TaxID=869555 RepID=A0ABS4HT98_9BACL|nr:glycosyl hydrolase family 18 protein [Paenibacillus aceris]MBP1961849.1 spore germination protein YaaH [Paenibacillus aceris]NHW34294.1 glycoside hydrolase family 18 [Paenibacillus aceris]
MKIGKWMLTGSLLLSMTIPQAVHAAGTTSGIADKTTKYRVYQYNQILMEFANYKEAETFAKGFSHSYVEEIGSRKWLWNNFPRYQVYQLDATLPEWQFSTLDAAIAEAKKWSYASVRDLESTGWAWNNYPRYQVYQNEITLDSWKFQTLNDAIAEAKKWGGAHIIDLNSRGWVWDNISSEEKKSLRAGEPLYKVYQGTFSADNWEFASLEDAINESLKWGNSTVINKNTKKTIYSNLKTYKVFQNDTFLQDFTSLDEAADYAKLWGHASIYMDGRKIWNNYAAYQVYQNTSLIGEYKNLPDALNYSVQYNNSSIQTLEHRVLWDNIKKLQVWGWNGQSGGETIKSQVSNTIGLDVDSPSYFELADAAGNLKDSSNPDTVKWLQQNGYTVYPLVSNQFNASLTTQFLADSAAQDKFIKDLVERSVQLGVPGINVDFESLAGSDRSAFTAFITKLTAYAHSRNLVISIDLPRGSVKWNHLSAFDHEKLGSIVDYVVIMAYDQFYRGSTSAGSVAGIPWTDGGIQEFLSYGIPRDKIILGIPYYVREWKLDSAGALQSNRTVLMKDIPALLASKTVTQTWDNTFGQYRMEYQEGGFTYVFWLEDAATVKARLDMAKKYDIAGVAAWRLGYDQADLWKMILQNK